MKFFFYSILFIFFIFNNSFSKNTKLRIQDIYSDQITWKHIDFNLPEGDWIYYDKSPWVIHHFHGSCASFLNIVNKVAVGHYEICYVESGGKLRQILGALFQAELKNGKYDSCLLRPEYFYAKFLIIGASSNCFLTRHIDPFKELNFPDDPEDKYQARLKRYLKDKSIYLPKISLNYNSIYYSNKNDKAIFVNYTVDPEFIGAPKTFFQGENTSEYHRDNIDNYPIKKKFFKLWTKKMAQKHSYLKDQLKASNKFKLNFSDLD